MRGVTRPCVTTLPTPMLPPPRRHAWHAAAHDRGGSAAVGGNPPGAAAPLGPRRPLDRCSPLPADPPLSDSPIWPVGNGSPGGSLAGAVFSRCTNPLRPAAGDPQRGRPSPAEGEGRGPSGTWSASTGWAAAPGRCPPPSPPLPPFWPRWWPSHGSFLSRRDPPLPPSAEIKSGPVGEAWRSQKSIGVKQSFCEAVRSQTSEIFLKKTSKMAKIILFKVFINLGCFQNLAFSPGFWAPLGPSFQLA